MLLEPLVLGGQSTFWKQTNDGARRLGQICVLLALRFRLHAMIDPKWGEQLSAYNNGATYLIFRKDGPLHIRRAA